MTRFIQGEPRTQTTLFPERLEDYISDDNPVRVIEVFVGELDLEALGFQGIIPKVTGRPAYHPSAWIDGHQPKNTPSSGCWCDCV